MTRTMFMVMVATFCAAAVAWGVEPDSKVPQAGQAKSSSAGGDANLQPGVALPNPRFVENGDTIKDNLTGLTWRNAPFQPYYGDDNNWHYIWQEGQTKAAEWGGRLPMSEELTEFIKARIQCGVTCWSNTPFAYVASPGAAWGINLVGGCARVSDGYSHGFVWPVR